MKKLLVLALAVVLVLSLTVVASAATFDPYVGGEFQLIYSTDINGDDTPVVSASRTPQDGTYARYKSYVTGTVKDEETNTWAKVGVLFKTWNENAANNNQAVYEAGIKKIGDVLDIWYTNDENPNTKRGMVPIAPYGGTENQPMMKFGGDPGFSNGIGGDAFGFDYNSGNITVNVVYDLNKPNGDSEADNTMAVAATFKFDGGNVWVGTRTNACYANGTDQTGIGMQYGFGIGTLSVDYVSKTPDGGDAVSYIQANMNFTDLGLDATLLLDDGTFCGEDGGMGVGLVYNINDKIYVGGKMMTNDTTDADYTEYYVGIKHGVLETRIGSADNDVDSFFYATVHAGLW